MNATGVPMSTLIEKGKPSRVWCGDDTCRSKAMAECLALDGDFTEDDAFHPIEVETNEGDIWIPNHGIDTHLSPAPD
jgi:hypothetical protein